VAGVLSPARTYAARSSLTARLRTNGSTSSTAGHATGKAKARAVSKIRNSVRVKTTAEQIHAALSQIIASAAYWAGKSARQRALCYAFEICAEPKAQLFKPILLRVHQ
jgi:hypothetical protein